MGGKIIMRREVVPHIFECQPDRKRTATEGPARSLPMKRERKRLVAEAEAADEERVAGQPLALDAPSTSKFSHCCYNFLLTMLNSYVFRYGSDTRRSTTGI